MLKIINNKTIKIFVCVTIMIGLTTHFANAIGTSFLDLFAGNLVETILNIVAIFFNEVILKIASFMVALSGTLLNASMYFTTHLDHFINNSYGGGNVIINVWTTIRDISSIILIFFILWASIQVILGLQGANFGKFITQIVIMGILINFSFFFARILIDASNIVSLQFYNAIAPTNYATNGPITNGQIDMAKLASSGGLSDTFMGTLQVSNWFGNLGQFNQANGRFSQPVQIILIASAGTIVMVIAALSFLAAAMAAIIRLVLFIFLLAFSPLWIAAMAIPQLKDASDMWWKAFKTQLLFLPIYLGLMYVAIRIMVESGLRDLTSSSANLGLESFVSIFVGFAIIIFMINIPLIGAFQIAGSMGKFADGLVKGAKVKTGAWLGRNTYGMAASRLASNQTFQKIAGKSVVGEYALKGVRRVGESHDKQLSDKTKAREDFAKSLNRDGATAYAGRLSSSVPARVSMFGTIGRADRVAAAKILTARLKEVQAENEKLTNRKNYLDNEIRRTVGGLAYLPQSQRDEYDLLTGQNLASNNSSLKNEIADAQRDMGEIRVELNKFETNVGTSARNVTRRNY